MAEREKYRPVSRRLWDDHAFLSLGDDGRLVWLYLLTCPALPIPGVILGGPAAHAERLGWSTDRYLAGLAEVQRAGIPVRTEGRLTWLERALHHQPASNPNTVKGWGRWWCDVPPGPLKAEIWTAVRSGCNGFTDVFFEQFGTVAPSWNGSGNGYPNGLANGSGNGLGNHSGNRLPQDQDQDQDQDQRVGANAPRAVALTPSRLFRDLPARERSGTGGSADLEQGAALAGAVLALAPATPRPKRPRKPKPGDPTPAEDAAVSAVLERLSARTGVAYRSPEHRVKILARLRDGHTEHDLRAVIAYCADERGWQDDPRMHQFLRPATLFGPQTIAKYVDEARAYAERAYPGAGEPAMSAGPAGHASQLPGRGGQQGASGGAPGADALPGWAGGDR